MTAIAAYNQSSRRRIDPPFRARQTLSGMTEGSWSAEGPTVAAFSTYQLPRWLRPTWFHINDLTLLPQRWDGHEGRPVRNEIALFTIRLLLQVLEADGPTPQIFPLGDGGVQLEWHQDGIDLEIEIGAPNHIFVSFEDMESGEIFEKELSTDYTDLARIMRLLASRHQR